MDNPPSVPSPSPGDGDGSVDVAQETIGAVIVWYSRQLMAARRSGDEQRQRELAAQIRECGEDRERLADASATEVVRITELYTEHLKILRGGEN
ncbi:hypothetical protein ACIRPK_33900 [Kitasatospora sp. NPDC101801]|uniref:hypothetical protein n=1 Tax=Kitasatospora sp. NPDC101801 TaxID=3364103 RepID=UPI0037F67CDF